MWNPIDTAPRDREVTVQFAVQAKARWDGEKWVLSAPVPITVPADATWKAPSDR